MFKPLQHDKVCERLCDALETAKDERGSTRERGNDASPSPWQHKKNHRSVAWTYQQPIKATCGRRYFRLQLQNHCDSIIVYSRWHIYLAYMRAVLISLCVFHHCSCDIQTVPPCSHNVIMTTVRYRCIYMYQQWRDNEPTLLLRYPMAEKARECHDFLNIKKINRKVTKWIICLLYI